MMMTRLRSALAHLFLKPVDHRLFWIGLSLLVKFVIFFHGASTFANSYIAGYFGTLSGDSGSYTDPLEHFFHQGIYAPDFRMPGLAIVYLPFRLFFSQGHTYDAVLILQWLMAAVSVYYLAKGVYVLSRSKALFYLVFYVFLISTYSNLFDYYLLSDSFCCSATVFMFYFIARYTDALQNKYLFMAGLCFTWIMFLRQPYIFLPLVLVPLLYRLVKQKCLVPGRAIRAFLIFSLSFIVVDGAWTVRNYRLYHRIIPLRKAVFYEAVNHDPLEPLSAFVQSLGGDLCFWNPGAEIRWFNFGIKRTAVPYKVMADLPGNIYTSQFNKDSLLGLKRLVTLTQIKSYPAGQLDSINAIITEKALRYERSVKAEKPLLYHVTAPFKVAWRFIFENGTYNLFNKLYKDLNVFEKLLKWLYAALYLLMAVGSVMGIVFFPYKSRMFLYFFPVLYAFVLFPFVFRFSEFRYMVPAYPFMVVSVCYMLWHYGNKWLTSSAR